MLAPLGYTIAGALAYCYMLLFWLTCRFVVQQPHPKITGPVIYAYWHGRLVLTAGAFPLRPLAVLISNHRDGRTIATCARLMRRKVVTGSTKRGAIGGTKGMIDAAQRGYNLMITPDAPPLRAYEAAAGVIEMARLAGILIVPVALSCAHGRQLKNKDRFIVPRLFNTVYIAYGEPRTVARRATKAERQRALTDFNQDLLALTQQLDTLSGHPEWS